MGTKVYDNYADLITFNRNSKGTALRPIGYGDELVTNGTFDTASDWTLGTGWSISGGQLSHTSGTASLTSQTISLTLGKVYKATCDVISVSGGSGSLQFRNEGTTTSVTIDGNYVGSTVEVLYVAEGNNQIAVNAGSGTDPLTLFLHPEGVPRIEYDADRNLKGLLIEPDGENAMFPSIPDTTWSQITGVTTTTDDALAPDGTTTATKLEGTGSWLHRNSVTGTDTGTWTFSCWVKAVTVGTNNTFRLSVGGNNFSSNLTATGEWQRFEVTVTNGGGTVNGLGRDSSSNDADLYVWGAQLETGPIATSYMPTTISPFTRDADYASMNNVSGLIGQKEGTLYVEVDWRDASGFRYLLTASDNSVFNFVTILTGNTNQVRGIARVKNVELASIEETGATNTGVTKIAFAYKTNDFELYKNGSSLGTDTTGSVVFSSVVDTINLGAYYNYFLQANMWIRAIQIIPRRLSDEQLIELTS
jgi:hypothetical protein